MTIKSITQLLSQADADIPDNTTGLVEPADVRVLIKDFLDTMSPAYGAISLTSQALTLSVSPLIVAPFSTNVRVTAGFYTSNLTNGTVTRLIASAGIAGATDFIIASGSISGPNNSNVRMEIFKDGVATGFVASVTCTGISDVQGFNVVGIAGKTGADAVYDLRASGPAGNYTFQSITLLAQAQPVRSFT
jgi:hypothetical protein